MKVAGSGTGVARYNVSTAKSEVSQPPGLLGVQDNIPTVTPEMFAVVSKAPRNSGFPLLSLVLYSVLVLAPAISVKLAVKLPGAVNWR
jgi:hypothetical protein